MILINRVKELRELRSVKQDELATFLGMERTSLSKIENMHYSPSVQTMKMISDFFKLPLGDIFFNPDVSPDDTISETSREGKPA